MWCRRFYSRIYFSDIILYKYDFTSIVGGAYKFNSIVYSG